MTMKYNYSNELDVTATVEVSLRDLDRLIDILVPVAEDDDHTHRYRAADLTRALKDIRARLISQTHGYMTARADFTGN
jgi:hypothetical protein